MIGPTKIWVSLIAVAAGTMLGVAAPSHAASVIVGYDDCKWRYTYLVPPFSPPSISALGYNDSGWATACGPFIPFGECNRSGTPLQAEGHVLLHRHIYNSGPPMNAVVEINGASAVSVSTNGSPENSAFGPGTGCGTSTMYSTTIGLAHGDNVVQVRTYVRPGYGSWFGAQISADYATDVHRETWGSLKIFHR